MIKVTLTRVHWGSVTTANGPVDKVGIKTDVHGEKWLSAFESKFNSKQLRALKQGDAVNIVVQQNGDFLNFRLANKTDMLEAEVAMIKAHLGLDKATPQKPAPAEAPSQDEPDW
jgi:hypothetical protein